MKKIFLITLFFICLTHANSQGIDPLLTKDLESQNKWVDSILSGMTLEEKIGQLFMVATFSNKDEVHEK